MDVVNPTFGHREPPAVGSRPAVPHRGTTVAALSNNKPHAWELLDGIHRQVPWIAERPWRFAQKDRPAMPAPAEMLDELAADAGVAVVALAD